MTNKSKILKKIERNIEKSNTFEKVINAFKIGLSATQFGGPIVTLLSSLIPSRRLLRLEKFAYDIANDLKRIDDKLDTDYLNTDEFAFIFEQCFKAVSENYQDEKLRAFQAIIVNSIINNQINQDEKEFFLNLTNSLTVLHIKILKFLYQPKEFLKFNDLNENIVKGGFKEIFSHVFHGTDNDTIIAAFGDLYNYGFLNTNKDIFNTMTSSSGFHLLGTGDRITQYGEKYISFIKNIDEPSR